MDTWTLRVRLLARVGLTAVGCVCSQQVLQIFTNERYDDVSVLGRGPRFGVGGLGFKLCGAL